MVALNGFLNRPMNIAPVTENILSTNLQPAAVEFNTAQARALNAASNINIAGGQNVDEIFAQATRAADTQRDIQR